MTGMTSGNNKNTTFLSTKYTNSSTNNRLLTDNSLHLNDTIEDYKNHYEEKIVEIFQEMDRIRN